LGLFFFEETPTTLSGGNITKQLHTPPSARCPTLTKHPFLFSVLIFNLIDNFIIQQPIEKKIELRQPLLNFHSKRVPQNIYPHQTYYKQLMLKVIKKTPTTIFKNE